MQPTSMIQTRAPRKSCRSLTIILPCCMENRHDWTTTRLCIWRYSVVVVIYPVFYKLILQVLEVNFQFQHVNPSDNFTAGLGPAWGSTPGFGSLICQLRNARNFDLRSWWFLQDPRVEQIIYIYFATPSLAPHIALFSWSYSHVSWCLGLCPAPKLAFFRIF